MNHHCHARGCKVEVKPELLMCFRHWMMVPKNLRHQVWKTYRKGQEVDKEPSEEWHQAVDAAIESVASLQRARK